MNLKKHSDQSGEGAKEEERGLKFDMTVRFSDLLVISSGLLTIFYVWSTMDKRVALLEQGQSSMQSTVQEVKGDVKEIRHIVETGVGRERTSR